MPVTALELWTKVLVALGLAEQKAEEVLAALASQYPDLAAFEQAVTEYIHANLIPSFGQIPARLSAEAVAWFQNRGASPVVRNDSALS